MTRWRLAARLARREIRRHWARSLLVVAIVALPVLAAQAGAILWRSVESTSTPGTGPTIAEPQRAGADELTGFDPRLGRPPAVEGADRVETGFHVQDWTPGRPGRGDGPDDLVQVHLVGFVPEASQIDLAEGRAPAARDEVVVSLDLARDAGLALGDRLEVIASEVELEVVGLSGSVTTFGPTAWAGPVADGDDDWVVEALPRLRDSGSPYVQAEMFDLYWLPDVSYAVGRPPSEVGVMGSRPDEPIEIDQLVWGATTGAIGVGFVATICSAAFAIGARRQLRSLGTLATAGASPADLARAVLLQGTGLGLAGGTLATVLVYAGRAVVVHRWEDRLAGWSVPWAPGLVLGVAVLGVLAGTLAALIPALTASRVPTLSALAGRRPARRRRLWSPYVGIALLVLGLGLLSWSTATRQGTSAIRAVAAAPAVLLTMASLVALSPGVVAGIGRLCARARGTVRLAGRSIARDGMRSAAVVASTAVAVAIPVMVVIWAGRDLGYDHLPAEWRERQARLGEARESVGEVNVTGAVDVDAEILDAVVREVGPGAVVFHSIVVTTSHGVGQAAVVDPEQLRRATGDDVVADALASGAVVSFDGERDDGFPAGATDGLVLTDREVRVVDPDDVSDLTLLLTYEANHGIVSAETAAAIESFDVQSVLRPTPFTEAEGARLAALATDDGGYEPSYAALRDLRGPESSGTGVYVDVIYDDEGADPPIELLVFLGSLLIALAVIGVASALAAADGRPDEQVVAAVGAPPTVVRRRRALEATLTAAAATVLGGGLGAAATLVTIHHPLFPEQGRGPTFSFPVLDVLGVAVGTVVVIGGATWLALVLGARVRGRRDLVLVDG